jgi:hypothetical protein
MKTLDENFSYGYDYGIYNLRSSSQSQFNCYYTRASRMPQSFREECVTVCKKISDYAISQNKIPYVLLSGGLDSEIVVRSFVESGRDFRIITSRFQNNLNDHEIEYVEKLCNSVNINPYYIDIDIEDWLTSNEAFNYARDSQCIYAEMLSTMKVMSDVYFKMNGIPVLGNGDLYVSKEINPVWRMENSDKKYQWNYIEFEYIVAWARYAVKKEILGAINFFQHTPELVLSMALDPLISNLISSSPVGKQSTRSTKYIVYKKYWPEIELRPKFHGGERIEDLCDEINRGKLFREFSSYNTRWEMKFTTFIKNLLPYESV